jgi:hypothetical protein
MRVFTISQRCCRGFGACGMWRRCVVGRMAADVWREMHPSSRSNQSKTNARPLKNKALRSFDTSEITHPMTQRRLPEDLNPCWHASLSPPPPCSTSRTTYKLCTGVAGKTQVNMVTTYTSSMTKHLHLQPQQDLGSVMITWRLTQTGVV